MSSAFEELRYQKTRSGQETQNDFHYDVRGHDAMRCDAMRNSAHPQAHVHAFHPRTVNSTVNPTTCSRVGAP